MGDSSTSDAASAGPSQEQGLDYSGLQTMREKFVEESDKKTPLCEGGSDGMVSWCR